MTAAFNASESKFRDAGATTQDITTLRNRVNSLFSVGGIDTKETEILFEFADKDKNGTMCVNSSFLVPVIILILIFIYFFFFFFAFYISSEDEYVSFCLDKDQVAKRDAVFGEALQPLCVALGVQIGAMVLELGEQIKARHRY